MPMNHQKTWFQIIFIKLIVAIVAGIGLFFGAGAVGFPVIYQFAFAGYALLGFIVYVVLDMPPMEPLSGWKAGIGIIVFYLVVSGGYIIAGSFLPQFEPQDEIDGIARKTDKYFAEIQQAQDESLMGVARELGEKADKILARLNEIETGAAVQFEDVEIAKPKRNLADVEDPIERGRLVYEDHECGNCHQLGTRPAKKRGPRLDGIGLLMTQEQMREKIFEPKSSTTEGFEKRTKDKMPDKYPDVMGEDELDWLVMYLMTLKDDSVETPKPIFP
jgi:mono/diheme cytochrome c family protein